MGVANCREFDSNLAGLTFSAGAFDKAFNSFETSYHIEVTNEVTSTTVTPTVAANTSSVNVNGLEAVSGEAFGPVDLEVGLNEFAATVIDERGLTKSYTVTVRRAELEDSYEGESGNNSFQTAYDLSGQEGDLLSTINGQGFLGDDDWYRIEIAQSSDDNEEIRTTHPGPGVYSIKVYPYPIDSGHRNAYDLRWNAFPTPFKITGFQAIEGGTNIFSLTWESRPGDSYLVEKSQDMVLWTPLPASILSQGTTTSTQVDLSSPAMAPNFVRVRRE